MSQTVQIQARVLRLKDAPKYLGMDRHRFNKDVRPYIKTVCYGKRSIGFDRLDLDAWLEHHKTVVNVLGNSE